MAKNRGKNEKRSSFFLKFHYILLLCMILIYPSNGQEPDGVVITEADYQGLQAFKHSLVDPKGFLKSWNDTGLGACLGFWAGIKCVNGQVIAIQLPWRGLGGQITEKIGQLSALRKMSLHDNFIGGQIPSSIGFLRNLRGVYLFNNRFSGTIPPSIGNCLFLQSLDLSNNSLVGTIPPSMFNSNKIYRLNLSYNNLFGTIPIGLTQSPSLTFLSLQHNRLSGPIPDTWGSDNVTYQLQSLNLDNNLISGKIPNSFGRLPLLQEITLSHNKISGSIPEEIGSLPKIRRLDFSGNSISGRLPTSLTELTSLVELQLDNNLIDTQIPESIDGLKNLSILSLKNNKFNGEIPPTLGNISSLSQLDLSDNDLGGEIPSSLANLPNLTFFNVSNNNLSGPVPQSLAQKFNSSSFRGNLQLCGYSPSVPCPSSPPSLSPITAPPSQISKPSRRKLNTRDIILIAAGVVLAILLLLCCVLFCCLVKKRTILSKKSKEQGGGAATGRGEKAGPATGPEVESGGDAGGKLVHFDGPFVFTADDLLCATAEIMGKSTYGTVYKATLEDGNEVAVKRLREKIAKGQKEFESEVNALGKIRHENLLALRAYYLGPKGEKLLVFDYMPKGSLSAFLHARGPDTPINWPTRMSIIVGTTRGLNYLHSQMNMIHGNLKSSNILLDEHTNPKISDHGLSRLMTPAASSNVIATASALGYRAPELSKLKKANNKTDVYSLGVVILELLTGKSPGEKTNGVDLPQWVASIVKEEWTNEVFDLELMKDAEGSMGDELLNTLKLALHCVDPSPSARPEVHQVIQQLEEIKPELATTASAGEEGSGAVAGPSTTGEEV